MKTFRLVAAAATAGAALALSSPALADGDVKCNGGPSSAWRPMGELKKKAWLENWTVVKAQVEGDCYEVYARDEAGQVLEAFFHPVTLQKLVVFRRGREVFRAKGFAG
ncbi:PepSY domain-containing protein [Novosphingobium flavum]|uniref:PepSY domain-containing protein n=1 Tax=Novosphingobium flavum TaxID=1778672 RepID=A0A7X1KMN1_9SPHN|nr:PepSY domain-containing protein [Novosphingobium flavum]MBC2666480.1 PepSY domain-containing protein [Novosphingobium flavum]